MIPRMISTPFQRVTSIGARSFGAQRDVRIDPARPPRGRGACRNADDHERDGGAKREPHTDLAGALRHEEAE